MELDSPSLARNKLAAAHVGGPPEPEREALLRATLSTSILDREIRMRTTGATKVVNREDIPWPVFLNDVQVGHLCVLLMSSAGVKYDACNLIEQAIRAAVREAQAGWAETRAMEKILEDARPLSGDLRGELARRLAAGESE